MKYYKTRILISILITIGLIIITNVIFNAQIFSGILILLIIIEALFIYLTKRKHHAILEQKYYETVIANGIKKAKQEEKDGN